MKPTTKSSKSAAITDREIRGRYQSPDATMTLREGLAEYYRVNPGLSVPATITNETSAAYFHNHDCTHVIFGTHTGLLDEGINDMLTFFGVDIAVLDYGKGFIVTDEAKTISKGILSFSLIPLIWHVLRLTPRLWRHSRKMTQKWPWTPPPEYLDRPLNELRAEYGIEVFRPEL